MFPCALKYIRLSLITFNSSTVILGRSSHNIFNRNFYCDLSGCLHASCSKKKTFNIYIYWCQISIKSSDYLYKYSKHGWRSDYLAK